MADTIKVLGQSAPSGQVLTAIYTAPAKTSATVSSITICNRGSTDTTFRVAVSVAGASISDEHYIYYDQACYANDTFTATIGITLVATDIIRIYAGNGNLSFNVFGIEST